MLFNICFTFFNRRPGQTLLKPLSNPSPSKQFLDKTGIAKIYLAKSPILQIFNSFFIATPK